MSRNLLIMRHAKSAWDTEVASDYERPLAKRGRKDAPRMGRWIKDNELLPNIIISSPALRASQTATAVADEAGIAPRDIRFEKRIYGAGVSELVRALSKCPADKKTVLLVGHNPGLDELLEYLSAGGIPRREDGKLLTTGALVHLKLPNDWRELTRGSGKLVVLVRPRELKTKK